jgi:hypothetical protein
MNIEQYRSALLSIYNVFPTATIEQAVDLLDRLDGFSGRAWNPTRTYAQPLDGWEFAHAVEMAKRMMRADPELAHNKITFIKALRGVLPGMGLRDSKSVVETIIP